MIQRQVGSRFTNRDEGLAARIRRMLEDLRNFKIANPDAQKQMEDMLARVETVRDRNLGPGRAGPARGPRRASRIAPSRPTNASPTTPGQEARRRAGSDLRTSPAAGQPTRARAAPSPRAKPAISPRARAGDQSKASRRPVQGRPAISPRARPAISPRARPAISPKANRVINRSKRVLVLASRPREPEQPEPSGGRTGSAEQGRQSVPGRIPTRRSTGRGQDQSEGDRRRAPEDAR